MNKSDDILTVELLNESLWQQFFNFGTEMILTKKGRHLFPTIEVLVGGLDPHSFYSVQLEFIQDSPTKYRFSRGRWNKNGNAESLQTRAIYCHEHSPKDGRYWMKSVVSFRNIKITNSPDSKNCVVLNSLCSYHVQVHILKLGCSEEVPVKIFDFSQTRFITVTAYQNANITQLKCKHNVFARRKNMPRKRQDGSPQSNVKISHKIMFQSSVHPQQHLLLEGLTDFNHSSSNVIENHSQNIYENQHLQLHDSFELNIDNSGAIPSQNAIQINSSDLKNASTTESNTASITSEICGSKSSNSSIILSQNIVQSSNEKFTNNIMPYLSKSPELCDFYNYHSYKQSFGIEEENFSTISVCHNTQELFYFPICNEATSVQYDCETAKNEICGIPLVYGNISDTNF